MSQRASPAWASRDGAPVPQGATCVPAEEAYNFALYSKHAERVHLLLYRPDDLVNPVLARTLEHPRNKTGRIWHCRVPLSDAPDARYYAYQVEGPPATPASPWHRFDPAKVLFDPYARALHFPEAFDPSAATHPGENAGRAPVGLLPGWRSDPAPVPGPGPRHQSDTVIYELHVRGFTRGPGGGVSEEEAGRFRGIIQKIPYLVDLGVTAVELMPVFQREPTGADNEYWGYMPISFFALESRFTNRNDDRTPTEEFREVVEALHGAGIEVLLDVVYNHTGERGERGPTYSFKGIDNSTYYLMSEDPARPYVDLSGTGNAIHAANAYVRKLVVDSMRYWAGEMGVDGFRFDLASVFAQDVDGCLLKEDSGLFGDIIGDPMLGRLRLIAEPWDATGRQLLGRTLPGITWGQWNGRYQEDVRRFIRGDPGMVGPLMTRLYGSDDLFPDDRLHAYKPWQSVNYVTSHDGFTLYDLVSYERKRNEANGHANQDGTDRNFSWNCGWEGDEDVPADVARLRQRQARNLIALLMLSNGTPMLRAGDEFLHTQGGNNNPYNQDNEIGWLDWRRLEENRAFHRFVRSMIAFRKAHPSLSRNQFWRGDVHWYGPDGPIDLQPDSRCLAYWLGGAAEEDADLYIMINGDSREHVFTIQEGAPDCWALAVDTGLDPPAEIYDAGDEEPIESGRYTLSPRSVVVLVRRT